MTADLFDVWLAAGDAALAELEADGAAFWPVGDWLAEGWARFVTGQAEQALAAARLRTSVAARTTVDVDTLRAARTVAETFAPHRRVPGVTIEVYRRLVTASVKVMAVLPRCEVDALVGRAGAEGWDTAQLVSETRARLAELLDAVAVENGSIPEGESC